MSLADEKSTQARAARALLAALLLGLLLLPGSASGDGPAPTSAPPPPPLGSGSDGFSLGARESGFQLRLRGLVQADARTHLGRSVAEPNTFLIRRARPILEGTVGNLADFRLLPDFGDNRLQLLDAYVDLMPCEWLQLRAGKYKSPFGLERLQQDAFMPFLERGLPSNLVPDRDLGVSLHGRAPGGLLSYELGVFDGAPDGGSVDADPDATKDLVSRVFAHPFLRLPAWARGLGLGLAIAYGRPRGSARSPGLGQFRSAGQNAFFTFLSDPSEASPSALAQGARFRFSPQLSYFLGSFGLLVEYVESAVRVTAGGASARLVNRAWQVEGSFALTGERAAYDGLQPRRPFLPRAGQLGAVELAARFGELRVDRAAFPRFADRSKSARAARAWAVAVNWYLTRQVKLAAMLERTTFQGGAPAGGRRPENALIARVQVAF